MATGLFDLTGKVVLATGANSGIGLGFLQGCAKQGADVVVWSRRADKNREAMKHLKSLGAPRAHAEEVDVSDVKAVQQAFDSTLKAMGRVDCVFANAGYSDRAESFADMTDEMYHNLMNVSLHGAVYVLREACKHMRDRARKGDPGGSLVACGSGSIFHGLQGMEHYAGAKGALLAIIKSIAVEMGQYKVRANMLAPGMIMTGMMDESSPRLKPVIEHFSKITPIGRVGRVSDMEGAAAYLASDCSEFHTGDCLLVDGGLVIRSTSVM